MREKQDVVGGGSRSSAIPPRCCGLARNAEKAEVSCESKNKAAGQSQEDEAHGDRGSNETHEERAHDTVEQSKPKKGKNGKRRWCGNT